MGFGSGVRPRPGETPWCPRIRRPAIYTTNSPAVEWLLSSADPSVRYLTLTEVLGSGARARAVREARDAIPEGPRVRALLAGQRPDGGFGVHPYAKWTGSFWRMISLVELGIPAGHPGAVAAAKDALSWLESPQHLRAIRVVDGLTRQHATAEGHALAVCCRLGMARSSRAHALAASVRSAQWPDGGWNCDPRPGITHSSFHETVGPLWGLGEYARATGDADARAAAERAAGFLLSHQMFRSHRTGSVIHPEFLNLHYPPYWHYDILFGLVVLARSHGLGDPRATEALDLIESKRGRDGRWRASGHAYWRPRGSSRTQVDVVDWGRRGANEMITLNALRVLRAAGRWKDGGGTAQGSLPGGRNLRQNERAESV
jgi:hypothetical protein